MPEADPDVHKGLAGVVVEEVECDFFLFYASRLGKPRRDALGPFAENIVARLQRRSLAVVQIVLEGIVLCDHV